MSDPTEEEEEAGGVYDRGWQVCNPAFLTLVA